VGTLAVVFACGSPLPTDLDRGPGEITALETPGADAPDAVDVTAAPSFIPYDTPPALRNRAEVTKALNELYPEDIRAAGIGGRIELWLYIDESGTVANQQVKTSSGNPELDAAAEEVARRMRFSAAQYHKTLTGVWVSQWVTFEDVAGGTPVPSHDASGLDKKMPDNVVIVIDGVVQAPGRYSMSDLGKLDIEHVELVKGAEAERLYGDRAKNGVVAITTKGGDGFTVQRLTPTRESPPASATNDVVTLSGGVEIVGVDDANAGDGPLIVIDGVIQPPDTPLSDVRKLDIDHIDIIKGATSRELYGDRAKNGVIQITTKDGSGG